MVAITTAIIIELNGPEWLVFWKWIITCLPNVNCFFNPDAKNRCSLISRMTQFNWLTPEDENTPQ